MILKSNESFGRQQQLHLPIRGGEGWGEGRQGRGKMRRKRASCCGSVLTEACIGLALMAFVWILITYTSYMADNRIRTAMASRHAAWMVGNNPDLLDNLNGVAAQIDNQFFYQPNLVKIERTTRAESGGGLNLNGIINSVIERADKGQFRMKVTYGITSNELASTTTFPFVLMKSSVPFMPSTTIEKMLSVDSASQWAEVGNTWDSLASILSSLLPSVP